MGEHAGDASRWRDLSRHYHAALDLPVEERAAYVVAACAGDAALQRELESLLACHSDAAPFLEAPAASAMPRVLPSGTRVGGYEIQALLGVGGMGHVYHARDSRLKRDVALKVLPGVFAGDAERLARFRREAEVLAALNHPHIAAIYGLEESDGLLALVLELVPGEPLSERLRGGPLPVNECLSIAGQMADALDAAHEHGVIHRDLKPANVMVTPDGIVKVLDFGLAKLVDAASQAARLLDGRAAETGRQVDGAASTPGPLTDSGLRGTAAYMSPEQLGGQTDRRSDIWSFGGVVYEMLTGHRAMPGDDITHVIAAVAKGDVDWSLLPPTVPPALTALLKRCLEKDRRRRISHVSAALAVIDDLRLADGPASPRLGADAPATRTRHRVLITAALVAAALAGAGTMRALLPSTPARVATFRIHVDATHAIDTARDSRNLAVSFDGSHVAWVGPNGALVVRALRELDAEVLARDGSLMSPFFSHDGRWIGYFSGNGPIMKVSVSGGPASLLVQEGDNGIPRGATWGEDGSVVFATNHRMSGLQITAPGSTASRVLTVPDRDAGEADHVWPEFLPGGRRVLFTITSPLETVQSAEIAVVDRETGRYQRILSGGSQAKYLATGHLVYVGHGGVFAVPFDPDRLETTGPPSLVIPTVIGSPAGTAEFDVAGDGTLVYAEGQRQGGAQRELSWVDRNNPEPMPLGAPARAYLYPRVSSDGNQVLLDIRDQDSDVWLWDPRRATLTNVTRHPSLDRFPLWMPTGREFLFVSSRDNGLSAIYRQPLDGRGEATRVSAPSVDQQTVNAVTRDGRHAIVDWRGDLWLLDLDGSERMTQLFASAATEQRSALSPDQRWLAYQSDQSGQWEIYVRPWPQLDAVTQVSSGGGIQAWWSPRNDLAFATPSGTLMGVTVGDNEQWPRRPPAKVVEEGLTNTNTGAAATFDIGADDRFLMVVHPRDGGDASRRSLVVVQNWTEELKRRLPAE